MAPWHLRCRLERRFSSTLGSSRRRPSSRRSHCSTSRSISRAHLSTCELREAIESYVEERRPVRLDQTADEISPASLASARTRLPAGFLMILRTQDTRGYESFLQCHYRTAMVPSLPQRQRTKEGMRMMSRARRGTLPGAVMVERRS